MKLETFFEKFDQFVDSPDAVAKMRELVLSLAFQGKLVAQDSRDEPATALLGRLQNDKFRLVDEGSLKSQKLRSAAESDVALAELPAGWAWSSLGELSLFVTSGSRDWAEHYSSEGAIFVRMGNLSRNSYRMRLDKIQRVKPPDDTEGARTRLASGDILISITGEVGLLGLVPPDFGEAYINQHTCLVRLPDELQNRFVPEYLRSSFAKEQFNAPQRGLKNSFRLTDVTSLLTPVPPLAEQRRIVAKVDELMALCDRLEAQQQERETRHAALARASLARFADAPTPANLQFLFHPSYAIPPADLRKCILTLAVRGKLVPQDANEEPVEKTFPKLAAAGVVSQDDGFPLPWLLVPLGKMGEWRGGGTPSKSRPELWSGDLPWVSPKDMKVLHIGDSQDHISPAAVEGSSVKLIPPGSLLMVVRGMILARAFPVALTTHEVTINQDMKALLPCEPKTKEYLLVALRAFECDVLSAVEHSSHGTCKLKTEFLQDYAVPIPPLAEQRRIVAKVEQLMTLVDQFEEQLSTAESSSTVLLEAIVRELSNPSIKPTQSPRVAAVPLPDRAAIGCYTIQKLADRNTFGRTAQVKVLYLAEAHVGLKLGGQYMRDAAGPLDQWIYAFEKQATERQWFSVVEKQTNDDHKKIHYRKGPNLSAKAGEVESGLPAELRKELDRLLALLASKPTVEVEIIATLFAAWNDFLIDGQPPSDAVIIRDVRENWHPSKRRFTEHELKKWLEWMRQHALVPKGQGPHTCSQAALRLQ